MIKLDAIKIAKGRNILVKMPPEANGLTVVICPDGGEHCFASEFYADRFIEIPNLARQAAETGREIICQPFPNGDIQVIMPDGRIKWTKETHHESA